MPNFNYIFYGWNKKYFEMITEKDFTPFYISWDIMSKYAEYFISTSLAILRIKLMKSLLSNLRLEFMSNLGRISILSFNPYGFFSLLLPKTYFDVIVEGIAGFFITIN